MKVSQTGARLFNLLIHPIVMLEDDDYHQTNLQDLKKYQLIVYPHATILTAKTAALLKEYVSTGGKLIMGARSGYKDERGHCYLTPMPGFASDLCGVTVSDFTAVGKLDKQETVIWDGTELDAIVFNDILTPCSGGEPIAWYKGN